MYFTVIFGSMPLLLRLLIASADPKGGIPYFSLSDIAFLGIMFNTAAIANLSSSKGIKSQFYTSSFAFALIHIMVLVAIHSVSMLPGYGSNWIWAVAVLFVGTSLFFSYLTTDAEFMQASQQAMEHADKIHGMHPLQQVYMRSIAERVYNGEIIDPEQGLRDFFHEQGYSNEEIDKFIKTKTFPSVPPKK